MKRFAILLPLALTACFDIGTVVKTETRAVTITSVDPPKRFHITISDTDNRSYDIYVAKRCSGYRQRAIVGSKVNVKFEYRRYKDGSVKMRPTDSGLYRYFAC